MYNLLIYRTDVTQIKNKKLPYGINQYYLYNQNPERVFRKSSSAQNKT